MADKQPPSTSRTELLVRNWDSITIGVITFIFLILIIVPFVLNNSLDKFDTPGLLSLSWFIKEHTFPDFQGWNPFFYGGFPQGILYPPLFHYVVAGLSFIFSLQTAFKIVVSAAILATPISVLAFTRRIYKSKLWEVGATILILTGMVALPGYLGFNFDGLLDYGLAPSFAAIPLFFLFLSQLFNDNHSLKGIAMLMSVLILTHLLTAGIAIAITIVYTMMNFKRRGGEFVLTGVLIFLLTAFWVVPFLAFRQFTASGYAMRISMLYPLAGLMLSIGGLVLPFLIKKKPIASKMLSIAIVSIILAFIGLLDSTVNTSATQISIPLLHPFRIQIYSILVGLSILPYVTRIVGEFLLRLVSPYLPSYCPIKKAAQLAGLKYMAAVFGVIVIALLVVGRLNPRGVEEVIVDENADWQGRVMRVYKVSEVLDQSRAVIDKSVMKQWDKFATMGLLKESSYLAPYYQSLAKNIDSENYDWEDLDSTYIENKQLPQDKVASLAHLLWVKSVFTIDTNIPETDNCREISTFKTNSKDDGMVDRTLYICDYLPTANSNFAEVLFEKPDVVSNEWDTAVADWWTGNNAMVFTDKELEVFATNLDFTPIPQVNFTTDYRRLHIRTGIEQELPVLVKMSYFPKWKAYDDGGNPLQIFRTSPNLMIVPVSGSATLEYEMTAIEWATLLTSIIAWMSFLTISLYLKIKRS